MKNKRLSTRQAWLRIRSEFARYAERGDADLHGCCRSLRALYDRDLINGLQFRAMRVQLLDYGRQELRKELCDAFWRYDKWGARKRVAMIDTFLKRRKTTKRKSV